jgi:very-short-patch-repair endonuclease
MSTLSRKRMIQRLQNNEIPFLNTKIEQAMAKELTKRGIPFKQQFAVGDKFVCDFMIPEIKLIIECDGDYWHANPLIYKSFKIDKRQKESIRRDKYKDIYLKRKGWKVLRFFETDINKSIKQCVDQIEVFLKNN